MPWSAGGGGGGSWLWRDCMRQPPWLSGFMSQPSSGSRTMALWDAEGRLKGGPGGSSGSTPGTRSWECFFLRAAHCGQGLLWVGQRKRLSGALPIKREMGDCWALRASQAKDALLEWFTGVWLELRNLVVMAFAGLSPPSWGGGCTTPAPILAFPGDQQAMGEASF